MKDAWRLPKLLKLAWKLRFSANETPADHECRKQESTCLTPLTFTSPEAPDTTRTNRSLTQAEITTSWFTSRGKRTRLFTVFSGGTSFDDEPLPTRQFTVGYPFVLDAFAVGDRRGDHYAVLTLGALRQVSRLPDFLGGPVFVGGWLENGSIFTSHENADFNTHVAVGLILDTLVGPVLVATSTGLDGGWRTIVGIGRIVR